MTCQSLTFAVFACLALSATAWSSKPDAMVAPEKQLARHLLKTYAELGIAGRPVKSTSDVVKVSVALALQSVIKMEKNSISIATWIQMKWTDPFLAWSPDQFSGLTSIVLPASSIWKPDFVNYNDIHHKQADQQAGMDVANLIVESTGRVTWVPRANFQSVCDYEFNEELDDDQMVCPFVFGSWTYDASQVDIDFEGSIADFNMASFSPSTFVEVLEHSAGKTMNEYELSPNKKYSILNYSLTVRKAPKEDMYTATSSKSRAVCKDGRGKCSASKASGNTSAKF